MQKASDKFGAHIRSDLNVLPSEGVLIELDCGHQGMSLFFMLTWFQDRFTPEPNEPLLIVVRPGGQI